MRIPKCERIGIAAGSLACLVLTAVASADGGGYRLATDVVPVFEAVELEIDARTTRFSGQVHIDLEVVTSTTQFELHSEGIDVTTAYLAKGHLASDGGAAEEAAYQISIEDVGSDRLRVDSSVPLESGSYTLTLEFENDFNTNAVGLYRMENEETGYVFTQFEADDGREAFPMFDEPAFKIPYQLTLTVPEDHIPVTNTPVVSESTETDGWRTVSFAKTKPIPSYLLAIASGPLEFTEVKGLGVPSRIYTVAGQSHLTELAQELTPPILAEMERYFESRYPYEKLDFLAVPEYWPGAMEHPGAITFSDRLLLVDRATASVSQKRRLANVMAHELAHQWFGNVVTMEWWDDLWLNESFADWMGDKITHAVFPEFEAAMSSASSGQRVMTGDARATSTPIRREVTETSDLLQNVGLAYNKGKSVLSMFESWIGEESFRAGVNTYIDENRWGNARADDLWSALARSSEEALPEAMATFIEQPGFPMISVEPLQNGKLLVSQKRFHNYGTELDDYSWMIPITFQFPTSKGLDSHTVLLTETEQVVDLGTGSTPDWVLPKRNAAGYYRWAVPVSMMRRIGELGPAYLGSLDRIDCIGNAGALLDAGLIDGGAYLQALSAFSTDPDPMVLRSFISGLQKVRTAFVPDELQTEFATYVRLCLKPALDRVGIEPRPGEAEAVSLVRPRLISWLGSEALDEEVLAYAKKNAESYAEDPTSVDPAVVSISLQLSALDGDRVLFDDYRAKFEAAKNPADRGRYLAALGNFSARELREEALAYVFVGGLRVNELSTIPSAIAALDESGRQLRYEWTLANYDRIVGKIPPVYMSYMPMIAGGCSTERLDHATEFFSDEARQVPGTVERLQKVTEQVRDCVGLRDREGEAVAEYLRGLAAGN